jgi:hypothetical protein
MESAETEASVVILRVGINHDSWNQLIPELLLGSGESGFNIYS